MTDYDVIFVGAGIGSLIASVMVAKKGLKTAIFEKGRWVGGRAIDVIEYQGYQLETTGHGITSIYLGEAMKETGVELKLATTGSRVYLANECQFAPVYLKLDGPSLIEALTGPEYRVPQDDVPKVVNALAKLMTVSLDQIRKLKTTRLQDWIDREGIEPAAARALKIFVRTAAVPYPVEEVSIGETLMFFKDASEKGVNLVFPADPEIVGYRSIPERFAAAARKAGVDIQTEKRVTEVLVDKGAAKGVVVQDSPCGFRKNIGLRQKVTAKVVVSNLQAWDTFKIIDESLLPKSLVRNARRLQQYNIEAVDVWCGMRYLPRKKNDGRADDFAGWNRILRGPDRLFGGGWMFTSLHQPRVAPQGRHLFFMRRGLPLGTLKNNDFKKARDIAKTQMDIVKSGYLDFDDAVEWERVAVHWPYCWPTYCQAPVPKLPLRCPGIGNLYFVGDTTEANSLWTDRAACSGLNTARAVLADIT